ncbi:hypothetical protein GLW00_06700 [Halobacillus litoralis]|uniref:Uncharacterized protein n=1 Tax=Halobacillus litoralis TaxID=45668 RepID=A0A845F9G2_9BACI|nr:hypothetical protein [Halobacillus litoralis]MYL70529.1 hypothetical protein [Halobacillus litoralis]
MEKWKFLLYSVIAGLLGVMVTYMLNEFNVDWPSFIGIFFGIFISQFVFMLWRHKKDKHSSI